MSPGVSAAVVAAWELAGSGAPPADAPAVRPTLTICMAAPDAGMLRAQRLVVPMFAAIGVNISWQRDGRACPPDGVDVALLTNTPPTLRPGSWAQSFPFDGTYIHVFYDRVMAAVPADAVPYLLAHVLAHEITHVVQAIDRHSDEGLMKRRWVLRDLQQMMRQPLPFTAIDVDLIYRGLASRAVRLGTRPPAPAPAR